MKLNDIQLQILNNVNAAVFKNGDDINFEICYNGEMMWQAWDVFYWLEKVLSSGEYLSQDRIWMYVIVKLYYRNEYEKSK